jgi:Ca2+-binding EF-hand superfamily protein
MGIAGHKFKRNDKIPGQGLQVLVDAKALKIKATQLDRLFHEFQKFAGEDNLMDYEGFLSYHELKQSPFTDILLNLMDLSNDKDGLWNFYQYLITMWNYLSTDDDNLATMIFNLFDIEGNGVLEVFEVKYILNLIHLFNPGTFTRWAIDKVDLNEDGYFTIAEFVLLCRHHGTLLQPITDMKKKIRKRVVHSRFWREIEKVRRTEFNNYTFFDVLVITNTYEIKMKVLNNILLRNDIPLQYKDKWLDIQSKKNDITIKRSIINNDLPPETLTLIQLGIKEELVYKKTELKKRDQGAFAHLHTDFNDENALTSDDHGERINNLVDSLKAQHSRQKASSSKKSKVKNKIKSHNSVKSVVPGIPTIAGPEPVGAQSKGAVRISSNLSVASSSG